MHVEFLIAVCSHLHMYICLHPCALLAIIIISLHACINIMCIICDQTFMFNTLTVQLIGSFKYIPSITRQLHDCHKLYIVYKCYVCICT